MNKKRSAWTASDFRFGQRRARLVVEVMPNDKLVFWFQLLPISIKQMPGETVKLNGLSVEDIRLRAGPKEGEGWKYKVYTVEEDFPYICIEYDGVDYTFPLLNVQEAIRRIKRKLSKH